MSRFAQIASIRAPAPVLAGDGIKKPKSPEDTDDADPEDEEINMTEDEIEKMKADARAEGVKATSARYDAVLSSEHYAGREATAHKLLTKDAMSAEDIIGVLADIPAAKPAAAAAVDKDSPEFKAAVETANRAAMAAALPTASENADLLDGVEPDANAKAESLMVAAVERRNAAMAATA